MRTLLVATNATPTGVREQIGQGDHHRIDYVELADRYGMSYLDYNSVWPSRVAQSMEERLRLDLRQALRVAQVVRRERHDVVFSMSERVAIPLGRLLNRRVRHVVVGHHLLSFQKLCLVRGLGLPARWDTIMVPTRAEASALRAALPGAADRIRPLRNVVDDAFYRPDGSAQAASQREHILSLGLAHRDYPTLISAMRRLPGLTCHISAGSLWPVREAGSARGSLPSNVVPQPYVAVRELPRRYLASRFVVVPLLAGTTHWSAGTISVLQAQSMGRAVVATRTPGITDYVRDGETGILVDGGDPGALAQAVEYLWRDGERASAMGRRARQWIEATFSFERWLEEVAGILGHAGHAA
jgi:glycosyltransferase involved in cell wall biosynthesis